MKNFSFFYVQVFFFHATAARVVCVSFLFCLFGKTAFIAIPTLESPFEIVYHVKSINSKLLSHYGPEFKTWNYD